MYLGIINTGPPTLGPLRVNTTDRPNHLQIANMTPLDLMYTPICLLSDWSPSTWYRLVGFLPVHDNI